ncbi:neuron-specific protein family member 1 [Arapaima gigas]
MKVKVSGHVGEKSPAERAPEDGFDTIPLITPLDVNQLQVPPAEKVVVRTKTDYDGDRKKSKFRSPKMGEFTISIIEGVSERLKVTLLVICALAFLVCVVFLVVYKVYQYEQPCPEGFIYTQGRCIPAGVYSYYPPQGPGGRGRLFTIINHYNVAKQTITRSVSPWMTIMSEENISQQETETHQKLA